MSIFIFLDKDVDNISTSRRVRTLRILAQVITGDCASSRSVPYMAYLAPVVRGVWGGEVAYMQYSCLFCLCTAGRVSFSTGAPVQSLTTVNQRRT